MPLSIMLEITWGQASVISPPIRCYCANVRPRRNRYCGRPADIGGKAWRPGDSLDGRAPRDATLDSARAAACNPTTRLGRVAQRESTPFTREGSQVQSLSRPPCRSVTDPPADLRIFVIHVARGHAEHVSRQRVRRFDRPARARCQNVGRSFWATSCSNVLRTRDPIQRNFLCRLALAVVVQRIALDLMM